MHQTVGLHLTEEEEEDDEMATSLGQRSSSFSGVQGLPLYASLCD